MICMHNMPMTGSAETQECCFQFLYIWQGYTVDAVHAADAPTGSLPEVIAYDPPGVRAWRLAVCDNMPSS